MKKWIIEALAIWNIILTLAIAMMVVAIDHNKDVVNDLREVVNHNSEIFNQNVDLLNQNVDTLNQNDELLRKAIMGIAEYIDKND